MSHMPRCAIARFAGQCVVSRRYAVMITLPCGRARAHGEANILHMDPCDAHPCDLRPLPLPVLSMRVAAELAGWVQTPQDGDGAGAPAQPNFFFLDAAPATDRASKLARQANSSAA